MWWLLGAALAEEPGVHAELARALAVARAQGAVCETEAYADTLLEHARRAAADPALRARFRDPVFAELAGATRLRVAAGVPVVSPGLRLYGPAAGVYGNFEVLELAADGVVVVRRRSVDDPARWVETRGAWKAVGDGLWLELGDGPVTLTPTASGEWRAGGEVRYTDSPSECEA